MELVFKTAADVETLSWFWGRGNGPRPAAIFFKHAQPV